MSFRNSCLPPTTGFKTHNKLVENPKILQPPSIQFYTPLTNNDSTILLADPPGAQITCTYVNENTASLVILDIRDTDQYYHIANITVFSPEGVAIADEVTQIASALYWSWWRALKVNK